MWYHSAIVIPIVISTRNAPDANVVWRNNISVSLTDYNIQHYWWITHHSVLVTERVHNGWQGVKQMSIKYAQAVVLNILIQITRPFGKQRLVKDICIKQDKLSWFWNHTSLFPQMDHSTGGTYEISQGKSLFETSKHRKFTLFHHVRVRINSKDRFSLRQNMLVGP